MLANERREKIYEIIQRDGAVSTVDLFQSFDVSAETLRRDLVAMEEQGKLVRVYGGALARGAVKPFTPMQVRRTERIKEKREIANKVAEIIEEGDIIALDAGNTAIYLAEAIKEKHSRLTIVTYSLDVFNVFANSKEFEIILCGGNYCSSEHFFAGDFTFEMLNSLNVQKSFVLPSAISLDGGICEYHSESHQNQRRMLHFAEETYVVGDYSKFEKKALYKLDDMRDEYFYVTDSSFPEALRKIYELNEKKLIIADPIK
jgi:DeoR/GlpR family transcriptional regulator of sugar metabolism